MASSPRSLQTESLTPLHWVAILLAVVTGSIHLFPGVGFIAEPLGWSFLGAALGFFAGVVAVLLDYRRQLVYVLGIPFTAGQIVLWYVVNAPDFSPLGIGDKIVQVALVVVIAILYTRET